MQKSDMYDFLVRAAIPPVAEEKNTPEELWEKKAELEKGRKEENRERTKEEEEFNRNEWIWRSVYRAHRDVVVGRQYVEEYSGYNSNEGPNAIADSLYKEIIRCLGSEETGGLTSESLLCFLNKEYNEEAPEDKENVPYGQLQKLVNMTLKYLLILNTFEVIKINLPDEERLDCPLDSVILESLESSGDLRWTRLSKTQYYEIQKAIDAKRGSDSRIMYDFKNWQ